MNYLRIEVPEFKDMNEIVYYTIATLFSQIIHNLVLENGRKPSLDRGVTLEIISSMQSRQKCLLHQVFCHSLIFNTCQRKLVQVISLLSNPGFRVKIRICN
jgi:hypothetical protein